MARVSRRELLGRDGEVRLGLFGRIEVFEWLRGVGGLGAFKERNVGELIRSRTARNRGVEVLFLIPSARRRQGEGMDAAPRLGPILTGDEGFVAEVVFVWELDRRAVLARALALVFLRRLACT